MFALRGYLYILIVLSFLGTAFWAIDISGLNVSLFRVISIFLPIVFMIYFCNYSYNNCQVKSTRKRPNDFYNTCFIFWLVYSTVSIIWVKSYIHWIISEYSLFIGVLSILVFYKAFTQITHITTCLKLFYGMITIHSFIGWIEILFGKLYFIEQDLAKLYFLNHYPSSTLGNTNNFATAMLIGVFISLGLFYTYKTRLSHVLLVLNTLNMLLLIYFASSRANIVGCILGMIFWFICKRNRLSHGSKLFLLCIGFIGVMFIYPNFGYKLLNLIYEIYHPTEEGTSISVRRHLIYNGLLLLKRSDFMGVGAGNSAFYLMFDKYNVLPTFGNTNLHNWWLEILVDYGLMVFFVYCCVYFKLIFDNLKIYYNNSSNSMIKSYALSFASFLVAFMIGSISASSNMTKEYIWLFFALIPAFINVSFQEIFFSRKIV